MDLDLNGKYQLELIGITYNQIESGVYALILQQVGGTRRIPIIIGVAEAQSIECKVQDIITPRPLTHDLMVNIMRAFGLSLKEVAIRRLPNGVFAADLFLTDGERMVIMDSRSSDAIGLAVRTGTSIYTTGEVLMNAGFEHKDSSRNQAMKRMAEQQNENSLLQMSDSRLQEMLKEAVDQERYEEASRIKSEIERRNSCK